MHSKKSNFLWFTVSVSILIVTMSASPVQSFISSDRSLAQTRPMAGKNLHITARPTVLSGLPGTHFLIPVLYSAGMLYSILERGPATTIQKNKKKRKGKNRKANAGPLTDEQVRQHVNAQYFRGPNGVFRGHMKREEKILKNDDDQTKYLKKLERHPSLVLNADYQVSANAVCSCFCACFRKALLIYFSPHVWCAHSQWAICRSACGTGKMP